ncbi:hypothetical protein Nepgr_022729 [Nepenthes gracilis]|uniref:Uncharacterized protein n=1 Tax=Nepenthes gracilis TaxID=150966 RepID=A0AAD3T1G0_NEPGR|nr:hypothetical protein Nepgr_022729 [Nepenthes gracilis]
MSPALHLTSNRIPGYGQSESGCLPCLGVYGKAAWKPPSPQSDCKTIFKVRTVSVKCSSRLTSFSCKASSNNPRRNPEFPRQNRHGFSRNRNRQNEERDSSENGEESELLSMKNGPLLSLSHNNSRHQATAAPGPREREIVELFRKVQAQLRERMAAKEERKVDTSRGQSKERETVDSLLKLLRKHSIEHGKRKVDEGSSSADEGDKSRSFFNSDNIARDEPQELDPRHIDVHPRISDGDLPFPRLAMNL